MPGSHSSDELKETRVSDKYAAEQPPQQRKSQSIPDSDSLQRSFMHDQLEALLASPTLARVAERHSEGSDDPAEFAESITYRTTEPASDAAALREARGAGLEG